MRQKSIIALDSNAYMCAYIYVCVTRVHTYICNIFDKVKDCISYNSPQNNMLSSSILYFYNFQFYILTIFL